MARLSVPTAWTLTVTVIGAAAVVAWRAIFRRSSDCIFLLPRFFLILALQENLEKLPATVGHEDWEDFCDKLVQILSAVSEKLARLEGNPELQDGLERATKLIDTELVTFLQIVPGVPSILDSYLPKAGQTWGVFLREKAEDERKILDAEENNKELQKDLTKSCLHAIDQLLHEVKQSDFVEATRSNAVRFLEIQKVVIERYKVVKVFYATDRQVTEDGEYIGQISTRTQSEYGEVNGGHPIADAASALPEMSPLQYGVAEIGIPETHSLGAMEAPDSREEASPLKHVVILSVDTKMRGNNMEFLSSVNRDLTQCGQRAGELLIFIHGYNVTHKGALKRAAQLKYDLQFQGAVIAYSWSSKGTLYGYNHDEKTVEKTVGYLKSFLLSIMNKVNAPRVHILAHSMGNRALIRALDMLHDGERFPPLPCPLSRIIFAAADERRSIFEKFLKKLSGGYISKFSQSDASNASGRTANTLDAMTCLEDSPPHLSVYCSTDDWALTASKFIHNSKSRLGDTRSFLEARGKNVTGDNLDVIDASGMDISSLRHSYYGDVPDVIKDLQALITERKPASCRKKLHQIKHLGRIFYAFNKDRWP